MPSRTVRPAFPRHLVTAVLVSHDGERWLRRSLAALESQTRPAQRAVAVDTGSHDASVRILAAGLGASRIVHADRDTGFGAAIQLGLEAYNGAPMPPNGPRAGDGDPVEWVWILHDDCAPDPTCLEALLARADQSPYLAVLGAKARGWDQPRLLLEVGLTTDGAGHRHTGLERREVDQGQHDSVREVLAVGSAGMLVRRDVWDALGGFDPRLALFRDDLDFGWRANLAGHGVEVVTDAVVHHAQAAAAGNRRLAATTDFPRRVDRRNAMFTVLANASPFGLLIGLPRLAIATVFRAILFLLTRRPMLALDEIAAYVRLLAGTGALFSARKARASTLAVPRRSLRPLMAKPGARLRAVSDHIGDWLTAGRGNRGLVVTPVAQAIETGPSTEDDDDLPSSGIDWRRVLLAPGLLAFLGLTALALIAERSLIGGAGLLSGGRLLPAPGGASDVWSTYLAGFHPVAVGSTSTAPAYLPVLAAISVVFLGKAWLAVDVLLLGCVPLAGLTAYTSTRGYLESRAVRAYAAVTYALLPIGIMAVAGGRLGIAVAFVALPLLLRAVTHAFTAATRRGGWRHAWWAGLVLAIATAFAPDLLPAAALSVVAVAVLSSVRRPVYVVRFLLVGLIVLAVPVLLQVPWTGRVWESPGWLVRGTGRVAPLVDLPHPRPSDLLFVWPGGVGVTAWWLTFGLLVAAFSVLVRKDRVLTGLSAWALVGCGLVVGIIASHTVADVDGVRALGWPGAAAAMIGAGLVVATALGADGALPRLAGASFGLRQPIAATVAVLALTAPLLAGVAWLASGAPAKVGLARHASTVLPDFIAGNLGGSSGLRALVLRSIPDRVSYTVIQDAHGLTLDEAELSISAEQRTALDQLVQALSGGSGDAAAELGSYAIGYVAAVSPTHSLAQALNTTVGLAKLPSLSTTQVWKVSSAVGRLSIRPPSGDLSPSTVLPSTPAGADTNVPAGADGRSLVLANAAGHRWQATVNGHDLTPTVVDGWAQGFELPAAGGHLVLRYDASSRHVWLALELIALLVVLVLAAPSVRADDGPPVRPSDELEDLDDLEPPTADDVEGPDEPLYEIEAEEVEAGVEVGEVEAVAEVAEGAPVAEVAEVPAPVEPVEPALQEAQEAPVVVPVKQAPRRRTRAKPVPEVAEAAEPVAEAPEVVEVVEPAEPVAQEAPVVAPVKRAPRRRTRAKPVPMPEPEPETLPEMPGTLPAPAPEGTES